MASNSLLNRGYTKEIPEKSVIGGVPARLIKTNMSRIYYAEKEAIVDKFFRSHTEELIYRATPGSLL